MRVECQCLQRRQREGGTRGHVCPHQACSRVDVYQIRSWQLTRSSIPHFHYPWQARALSLLCTIYSGGICLCHTDVNVYTWWTSAEFLTVRKKEVHNFEMRGDSLDSFTVIIRGMWGLYWGFASCHMFIFHWRSFLSCNWYQIVYLLVQQRILKNTV